MANKKELKNLNTEEKTAVTGGDIYYSRENKHYYVPNPCPIKSMKHWWKQTADQVRQIQVDERAAGRGDKVHYYDTTAEAKAAAATAGLRIAAAKGNECALSILADMGDVDALFGTFTE